MPANRRTVALATAVAVACGALVLASGVQAGQSEPRAVASASVIAVIGDFGSGTPAERQVANLVARVRPTTIVTTGDNVYTSAGYPTLVGDYYGRWVTRRQFLPSTGNHDYAQGIARFDAYFGAITGGRVYAAVRGDVAFFVLDSQGALSSPASLSRQRAWLRSAMRGSAARWKVVVLHHPPYSSGTAHGSSPQFRWPFAAWGADLVLSGHEHSYERLLTGGVTYVVDGSGGKDLYALGSPLPGSRARDDVDYGALFLTPGATTLTGEFRAVSGRVVDRFSLPG
jgi:tartrate-resistant acid phosphatase type 5